MSLRQLQRRSMALLRDGGLLQALRAELNHELSSSSPRAPAQEVGGSLGPFTLEWDDPRTKDVVLRRWLEEEEVAVSAVLGPVILVREHALPRHAHIKVCVKKPGFDPVLRFDCTVYTPAWLRMMEAAARHEEIEEEEEEEGGSCAFRIHSAFYYSSMVSIDASKNRGPAFSDLDPQLKEALKEYLVARGIEEEFTTSLLQHLIREEQGQYVNWLQTLEAFISKDT